MALGGTPREQDMQLAALNYLRGLAAASPQSSVRGVTLTDVFQPGVRADDKEAVWYAHRVPGFELLHEGGDGDGARLQYDSVVLTPAVFLPWLREVLEGEGVKFERIEEVAALEDLKGLEHDVLVNASGLASGLLKDVMDEKVVSDRTYVTVVRSRYEGAFVHRGDGVYTYIFGRGDGTAVVGGVSESPESEVKSMEDVHEDVSGGVPDHQLCAQLISFSSSAGHINTCRNISPHPIPATTRLLTIW